MSLKPDLEKILKDLLEDLKEDVVGCAFVRLNGSMIAAKLPSREDKQIRRAFRTNLYGALKLE